MGLAIAYGVARQHGGWITVESEEGKGATFRFYLPQSVTTVLPTTTSLPPARRNIEQATVLVVDDEDIMRRAAERVLRKLGVDVVMARDGIEAIEVFKTQSNRIDIVLLDLNMPKMSGDEALEHIRSIDPHIPVIISSGHTRAVDHAPGESDAPLLYLQKPYTLSMVARVLNQLLTPKD